jgi:type I restriction enzyme, S subunit
MSTKIPPGWSVTSIGDLVHSLEYGYTAKAEHRPDGPRFLRITDIENGRIEWTSVPCCTIEASRLTKYLLKHADVVFARTGSIDKACMVRNPPQAVFASYLIRGRPLDTCVATWLDVFVGSTAYRNQANAASAGVGRANINAKSIGRIELRLAPLPEQDRIVAAIESYFTRLDDAVTSLERVQRNLKHYRASVLKAAVEGRLVPTEAELARAEGRDYESASVLLERVLAERRRRWEDAELAKMKNKGKIPADDKWKTKYVEAVAPNTSELPELPEGWCWATVDQISYDVRYGSSAKTQRDLVGGIPVLRMGNISDGALSFADLKYLPNDHPEFPDLLLQAGDLLFNRTNSAELVGKSAVFKSRATPCSYASYLICVRCLPGMQSEYVAQYINSLAGRAWIASVVSQQVGQANVNGTKLKACAIPVPPLSEQVRIVAESEKLLPLTLQLAVDLQAVQMRCARVRQSILKWAFEGRLADQDPTDEPASKLLERIKSSRAEEPARSPTRRPRRATSQRTSS